METNEPKEVANKSIYYNPDMKFLSIYDGNLDCQDRVISSV